MSPHIAAPLRQHPAPCHRADEDRSRQPSAPPRCAKDQPLAREMRECQPIRPQCQLIYDRLLNVIRSVQADDAAQSRPRPEGACAERRDRAGRGGGAGVDFAGAGEGHVGLDAVADGDY